MGTAIIIPGISFADSDMGKVTISTERPLEGLAIFGPDTVYNESDQAQYFIKYFPAGTTERGISWSIDSGSQYATINSSTGVLTVLTGAEDDTVVIKATSTENPSIFTYKEITVTNYVPHTIVPLAYIAADGGKYIDTGVSTAADVLVSADFKIPNIGINNTTDRQFVYSDLGGCDISYSKRWNQFTINYIGAETKYVASFFDRGLSASSVAGSTLYNKTSSQYVTMTSASILTGTYGRIYLFSNLNSSQTYKKVMIYGFDVSRSGTSILTLSPVLYDGVPCFYDSVSDAYRQFSGDSGNIWYATAADPNTEIQYTE